MTISYFSDIQFFENRNVSFCICKVVVQIFSKISHLAVPQNFLWEIFLQLILDVLDHQIREPINMPGSFQRLLGHNARILNLKKILLHDEVTAPELEQVRLHGAPRGAICVETCVKFNKIIDQLIIVILIRLT